MPILDPPTQLFLSSEIGKETDEVQNNNFFITFLSIAAKNMEKNYSTLETSIQFKKDISSCLPFIVNKIKSLIDENDINDPCVDNYYQLIYDNIIMDKKEKLEIAKKSILFGLYQELNDQFHTKLFRIQQYYNSFHQWFLSNTPIAILCLKTKKINANSNEYQSLKLEIDLLEASGYILVMCFTDTGENKDLFFQILHENKFSEVHYNLCSENEKYNVESFYKDFSEKYKSSFESFEGYFYFYANFINSKSDDEKSIYKMFKHIPRVKIISFTGSVYEGFHNDKLTIKTTEEFIYCKNGFDYNYLRIILSNVPLFDSDNDLLSFIPSSTSDIGIGYILSENFLNWNKNRVKILFNDVSNNNHLLERYINFDDIHKIRPDLYANDQLALAKTNQSTLHKIKKIQKAVHSKVKHQNEQKFQIEKIYSLFNDKKIQKSLEFVAYAYSYTKIMQGQKFFAHKTQIFTAYEACKKFIKKSKNKNDKGIIFQVETGEGKTCIVCLIAAALSLMKKTVHITSSNIKLSIRDYENSFKFFQLLNIKTAVLLHSNELPLSIQNKFSSAHLNEKKDNKNEEKHEAKEEDDNNEHIDKKEENNNSNQDGIKEDDNKNEEKNGEEEDNKDENIKKFKKYMKYNNQKSEIIDEYYSEEYYHSKLFKNSSKMNFSICGVDEEGNETSNKSNIIFSTFVNFECFYLKMMEMCPGSIENYFTHCSLIVDEADSILIDEIANGTIISRSMKSNSTEILKFVYNMYKDGLSYQDTYKLIKSNSKWDICKDLTEENIKTMFEEIKLVNSPEYINGKKYSIEEVEVKNEKKKNRFIKSAINFSKDILKRITNDFIKEFTADEDDDGDDDDDDDDDESNEEEDNEDDYSPTTTFRYIVPFGYDHNGLLEPNKEFGGFIQQFIAIKESVDNNVENMIVKDISMSYLYISHPIFVKLYGSVCGLTGTIGNKEDKKLFKDEYGLTTMKVPRHNPNKIVEFPMILCKNYKERNAKIINEILEFHKRGNPVLVIFQNLNELYDIEYLLYSKNIKDVNVFDGKSDNIKPDLISGIKGAISLGTNACGRGTDIIIKSFPLHVIVAYYSSNSRVMNQAFGRTARQGKKGSCRIICLKDQYFSPTNVLTNVDSSMNEFAIKNLRQREFVDHFKNKRNWIFSGYLDKQKIDNKYIKELRKTKINVNRIIAYNYTYPICMTIETFLIIQEQKIFSLFNCPNCKFTWKLFQRYVREMILESWSLMINKLDQKYANKTKSKDYDKELVAMRKELYNILNEYIPENNYYDIFETFMFLFRKVQVFYEKNILKGFTKMASPLLEFDNSTFFSCKAGFKPYALLSESGARICYKNYKKTNFIKDPELKYERRTIKNKFSIISITDKIDDIFNEICKKVNEIIGSKTFLRLFLRRTIAGCEFGFCVNLDIKNHNEKFNKENPYCIIDKDPLLVFTIFVRSVIPFLSIILISLLVYIGHIGKKIASWFSFPANAKEALKKTISIVVNAFASEVSKRIFDKIIGFLEDNLNKNIEQLKQNDEKSAEIISLLKAIFESPKAEAITEKLSDHLGSLFQINTNWAKLTESFIDPVNIMKISVYIMLLVASFILNYRYHKIRLQDYTEESNEFNDKCHDSKKLNELCDRHNEDANLSSIEIYSEQELKEIEESHEKQSKSYLYKVNFCNTLEKIVKISEFQFDKNEFINNSISRIIKCTHKSKKSNCFQISYYCDKKVFLQHVLLLMTNQYPSIIPFIGYNIEKNKQLIFVDYKEKGTLDNYINKSNVQIKLINKLIIAYGIACAMEYLHNNQIIHRNLNPSNILLDSNLYPFLYDLHKAKQIQNPINYILKKTELKYTAPEFIKDFQNNQNSYKIDVYSFGVLLYYLFTEKTPYYAYSKSDDELAIDIQKGIRPEFPKAFQSNLQDLKKLIINCWDENPENRPCFSSICNTLENQNLIINEDEEAFLYYKNKIIQRKASTL